MRGSGRYVWRNAAAATAIAVCGSARAGAFLEPPGAGQVIVTATFGRSLHAFDAHGRVIPAGGYRKLEISAYGEFGALENLTIVLKPAFEVLSARNPTNAPSHGPGWSEAGARVGLWRSERQVLSVQATLLAPDVAETRWGNNVGGVDARLLYGLSFDFAGAPAFVDVQAGLRAYGGDVRDELRLDATLGWRPLQRVLLLAQAFTIIAPARGASPATRSLKAQASVVYDFAPNWSAQIGVFATLWGVDAAQECGGVTGLWRRF